jgi:hypothetical protein
MKPLGRREETLTERVNNLPRDESLDCIPIRRVERVFTSR